MPYQRVSLDQGDNIYFFDTSSGDIVSRDWYFPGGTPTGATSTSPVVRYNSPNISGWNATLLVTDSGGITAAANAFNILVVNPENFSVSFYTSPSSCLMDQTINYISTGTAASGLTGSGYTWSIPGLGSTSGLTLSTVSYSIPEWYDLTGTYVGNPNQLYLATASLSMSSIVGNSGTTTQNVNFYKLGPEEQINYADSGTHAISGPYYTPSVFPYRTSLLGLGGNNLVFEINQNYPAEDWDNAYFHSTDEAVYYYPNTTDYNAYYGLAKFKFIWNGFSLALGGITVPALPRFNTGNYIITGDISNNFSSTFWITDYTTNGAGITSYYESGGPGGRNWSSNYIVSFLSNTYHLSTSSKFIENGGFTGVNGLQLSNLASFIGFESKDSTYDFSGGYGDYIFGVCVPSSEMIDQFYFESGVTVDIDITIYDTSGSVLDSVNVVLSSPGATGNSADQYLLLAQDTSGGAGIVSIINSAISVSTLNGFILAEEADYFAPYEGGGLLSLAFEQTVYSKTTYHGIRLSVIQPTFSSNEIGSFSVEWGPAYSTDILSSEKFLGTVLQLPFSGVALPKSSFNPASFNSWTGMDERVYENPDTTPYFRGWKLGGSL